MPDATGELEVKIENGYGGLRTDYGSVRRN